MPTDKKEEAQALDIITVKAGPKAGDRVALFETDEAHKRAGHKDGEVFVAKDIQLRVARTPMVEDKLRSKELVEVSKTEDKK